MGREQGIHVCLIENPCRLGSLVPVEKQTLLVERIQVYEIDVPFGELLFDELFVLE